MLKLIDQTPLYQFMIFAGLVGLAPFAPPHLWEKSRILAEGGMMRTIDWFDVAFHGLPWLLLGLKLSRLRRAARHKRPSQQHRG